MILVNLIVKYINIIQDSKTFKIESKAEIEVNVETRPNRHYLQKKPFQNENQKGLKNTIKIENKNKKSKLKLLLNPILKPSVKPMPKPGLELIPEP